MNPVSRILLSGLALFLAAASLLQYSHRGSEVDGVHRLLIETGVRKRLPEVAKKAGRERDPQWARMFIARALLAEHIDPRWLQKLSPQERQRETVRMFERLHLARELAAATFSSRPATWQAAMVLGGTAMLDGARSGVSGLLATSEVWEGSLRRAIELAPGQEEPYRLLAGAYLGVWPSLAKEKRQEARGLVARAFEDAATFRLFAELWLDVASGRDDAFELVPDRSSAWQVVKNIYQRKADWQGYVEAFQRWDTILLVEIEQELNEGETRLLGGDLRGARSLLLRVVRRSRLDTRYMRMISAALVQCPPGPLVARLSRELTRLLDWSLERVVLGKPGLDPVALKRLAGAVREPSAEQKALVALATDDLPGASLHERRQAGLSTESWGPYLLYKARKLAEENDIEAARAALAKLHPSWRGSAIEQDIRRRIAEKRTDASEITDSGRAGIAWQPQEWKWRGKVARLYLIPGTTAQSIRVQWDVVPPGGGPVEIRWDQESRAVALAASHDALQLNLKVTPDLHTLEVESLTDRRVVPGLVRLGEDGQRH